MPLDFISPDLTPDMFLDVNLRRLADAIQSLRDGWPPEPILPIAARSADSSIAAGHTYSSLTWADWYANGASHQVKVTHVKQWANSSILVIGHFGGYMSIGGAYAQTGVKIDAGADNNFGKFYFNAANQHDEWSWSDIFGAIGVGSHTYTARVYPGSANFVTNDGDFCALTVIEVAV